MSSGLRQAWTEFVFEVAARAPGTFEALRQPAGDLVAAEQQLGITFNDELRTWFALHDGAASGDGYWLTPGGDPFSLAATVEETLAQRVFYGDENIDTYADGDPTAAGEMTGTWIQQYVALTPGAILGGYYIDLRPGLLHGSIGLWDIIEADGMTLVAGNLADLVNACTDSLRAGWPVNGWTAHILDGHITWECYDQPDPALLAQERPLLVAELLKSWDTLPSSDTGQRRVEIAEQIAGEVLAMLRGGDCAEAIAFTLGHMVPDRLLVTPTAATRTAHQLVAWLHTRPAPTPT